MIEMTVALTIVLVASVGGFASHHASRRLIRVSEENARATADLENALNRVLLENVEDLVDPFGDFPDGQTIPAFDDLNLTNERIRVDYPNLPAVGIPDYLEIRMTLTWDSLGAQPRSLVFRTGKAR